MSEMINTQSKILNRLIGLYPVKMIKEHFQVPVTEVTSRFNAEAINGYVFSNLANTKQHIFIYTINKAFKKENFKKDDFPLEVISETSSAGKYQIICKNVVSYKVSFLDPYEEKTVKFYQPVIITFQNKCMVVQATILEKSINGDFENRMVVRSTRLEPEDKLLSSIRAFFDAEYAIQICDINKGIKKIWDDDIIDSPRVQYKKSKSTATETMDEQYTLKQQYPHIYAELMKGPLAKTVFRYLKDDNELSEHFTVNPVYGELTIPIFPKTPNQIINVIEKIISNN